MKTINAIAVAGMLVFGCASALAVDVPMSGKRDARVRFVDYSLDDVFQIDVRPGNVTRIVLESDEAIEIAASGFPADCKTAQLEWCIVAEKGMNQIWIKPLRAATHNNLEVKTTKRDYSFEFKVLPEAPKGRWSNQSDGKPNSLVSEPMARVIFNYPKVQTETLPAALFADREPEVSEGDRIKEILDTVAPEARNWNYSVKVGKGAKDIMPEMVFDDGRFTYFKYPKNRQVPAIFAINAVGDEARLNFTVERDELVAVHRLSQQFVLRQGKAVVGIWNESFDGDGVAIQNGVTVEGVARELK